MSGDEPASAKDRTAELAEQRWQIEVQRFKKRQIALGIGIAVCIAAGYPAAAFGQRTLAGLLAIGAVAGIAGVIYLAVKNRRLFIDIKMTGGLTREEAMSQWYRRYGGS